MIWQVVATAMLVGVLLRSHCWCLWLLVFVWFKNTTAGKWRLALGFRVWLNGSIGLGCMFRLLRRVARRRQARAHLLLTHLLNLWRIVWHFRF
jgi:hypothetical protein